MKKQVLLMIFLLMGHLAVTSCGPKPMSAEERAEYNRNQQVLAEENRNRIRQATGGKCETESCYSEYKLKIRFEKTCKNYGHRKNTAAFNQCVGMEINNYNRNLQLEMLRMQSAAAARDSAAAAREARVQKRERIRNYKIGDWQKWPTY